MRDLRIRESEESNMSDKCYELSLLILTITNDKQYQKTEIIIVENTKFKQRL